jgi:hypothetical protein
MINFIIVVLDLLITSWRNSAAQKVGTSPGIKQQELFLNRASDGQQVSAKVGQPIVVALQTSRAPILGRDASV